MGIIDEIKSVATTIQQIDNIDLYRQILNLQADVMEIMEENSRLKGENIELREKLRLKNELKFEHEAYWLEKPDKSKDGPFCSKCWDSNQKLIRMLRVDVPPGYENNPYVHNLYKCPECSISIKRIGG